MKKIFVLIIISFFIINHDNVIDASITAFSIWQTKLLPIIFPSLILSDLILSSNILNKISKNNYYLFILLIGIIAGSPTNIKYLNNTNLSNKEINIILSTSILFNPFFVISYCNLKIYVVLLICNYIVFLINKKNYSFNNSLIINNFNLNKSINTNINILFNILGILIIFMSLISIIPINNPIIRTIISGILEVTSGITKINIFITNNTLKDILYIFFLSLGGISLFYQIKSILKDTFIDIKLYCFNRLLVFILAILMINLL